jgi:menaquinol-cytochrome c reductase iron-sulfur subunit
VGLVAVVVPSVAGLITFFAPLGRRKKGALIRVASVDDIPADGVPRRFSVVAERRDAWNRYPREPIGAVFLRRASADGRIEAVSSVCPHLGCAVDFHLDGLQIEVKEGQVWVNYERFKSGTAEQVPV